ncbi:MAG: carboxymuconolactone decarboxylase family protein [Chitinophagaceae bacterium]
MKKFAVPTREQVSPVSQASFDMLHKALGQTPNIYATFAYSENGLSRYLAYQGAKTSLSNKEKEAVNLVVSEENGCIYCLSAHTVVGKMNGFSDKEILHLRAGNSSNPKLDALVKLAKDITQTRGRVAGTTLDNFYAAGYNDENLVDLIIQVSDKIAANYLHNLTEIPVDFPIAQQLDAIPV